MENSTDMITDDEFEFKENRFIKCMIIGPPKVGKHSIINLSFNKEDINVKPDVSENKLFIIQFKAFNLILFVLKVSRFDNKNKRNQIFLDKISFLDKNMFR